MTLPSRNPPSYPLEELFLVEMDGWGLGVGGAVRLAKRNTNGLDAVLLPTCTSHQQQRLSLVDPAPCKMLLPAHDKENFFVCFVFSRKAGDIFSTFEIQSTL